MTSERWQRVGEIYHAALEREQRDRHDFVVDACAGDEELRREVDSLLAAQPEAADFLEPSAFQSTVDALTRDADTSLVGRRLGPYTVESLIGVGGMGEVYRAKDTRLGRHVAIKCVPWFIRSDAIARARLEREARVLATLNHPNIAAVYGVEETDGVVGIVLELIEGPTLAECLATLSMREALALAGQIADALEAAHDKGVIHRDLKPSNIKVTPEGVVKVLDFGLAKIVAGDPLSADDSVRDPTRTGVVVGTAAYLSPEQARAQPLDRRTDLWSFGCVLFELIARRPAFDAETASDTLVRVLEFEPDWSALPAETPAPIRRLLKRCLEKARERRLRDIGDARLEIVDALATEAKIENPTGEVGLSRRSGRRVKPLLLTGVAALGIAAVAFLLGRATRSGSPATLTQLTFREGTIGKARFAPDGETVVYSAAWDGEPFRVFTTRVGSAHSRALDVPPSDLMAVSKRGDLAVSPSRGAVDGWEPDGVLAVTPLAGGGVRPLYDRVVGADWSADGTTMAIARRGPNGGRLEFPVGTVVHEANIVLPPRVSPDGSRACFFGGPAYGQLHVAERGGPVRVLRSGFNRGGHCAWAPDGREIWVESGGDMHMNLEAIDLAGRRRVVATYPSMVQIEDISASGNVLVSAGRIRFSAHGSSGGTERDLSVFDATRVHHLGADGRQALLWDNSPAGGLARVFLRGLDGTPAVPLGPGAPVAISPKGDWVAVIGDGKSNDRVRNKLSLLPTGVGSLRTLDLPVAAEPTNSSATGRTDWERRTYDVSSDGARILIPFGRSGDRPPSVHVYDLRDASMRQITPDGVTGPAVLSPDGGRVAVNQSDRVVVYPVDGGEPQQLRGAAEPGKLVRWSADGRALFVVELANTVARLFRRELATGERAFVREVKVHEPAGVTAFDVWVSGDGAAYAYSALRRVSNLFVIQGLR